MRNYIISMYQNIKDKIKSELKEQDDISLTCDAWTSPNCISIFGITAHWISKDWKLNELLLSAEKLDGSHSGDNMAKHLYDIIQDYEIAEKIFCITADNASNNRTMADQLQTLIQQFQTQHHLLSCFGHVINLAAKSGIRALSNAPYQNENDNPMHLINFLDDSLISRPDSILGKIHKTSSHLRQSPQRKAKFAQWVEASMATDEGTSGGPKCLILDVPTRWNSTLHMLERAHCLQLAYNMYVDHETALHDCKIDINDWLIIEDLIKLLKPLEEATVYLSGSKYPSISSLIPTYKYIEGEMDAIINSIQGRRMSPAARAIKEKIDKYFDAALLKPVNVCAMVLDPRFKLITFEDTDPRYNQVKIKFEQMAAKFDSYTVAPGEISGEEKKGIGHIFKKPKITNQRLEISTYLKEEIESRNINPLDYWRLRASSFPTLAKMARTYLGSPATSTPSERAFSKGRYIVTDNRGSLQSDRINELMCLNSWKKLGY